MIKNVNSLSDLLNFEHQKKTFDNDVARILQIIKEESSLALESKNIFIKNNNLKIKASSSIKFVILLHINRINQKLKSINPNFILEL